MYLALFVGTIFNSLLEEPLDEVPYFANHGTFGIVAVACQGLHVSFSNFGLIVIVYAHPIFGATIGGAVQLAASRKCDVLGEVTLIATIVWRHVAALLAVEGAKNLQVAFAEWMCRCLHGT